MKLTFYRVNAYFVERREKAKQRLEERHAYCKKVMDVIAVNFEKAAHHTVVAFDRGLFQVTTGSGHRGSGKGKHKHTVNVVTKTCTCKKLEIYKYPCSHVLAVCSSMGLSTNAFVDVFYTSGEYLGSYAPKFRPIPDEAYWTPLDGPKILANKDMKREPKKKGTKDKSHSKRLRNEMDEKPPSKSLCGICRQPGHNKKTCSLRG